MIVYIGLRYHSCLWYLHSAPYSIQHGPLFDRITRILPLVACVSYQLCRAHFQNDIHCCSNSGMCGHNLKFCLCFMVWIQFICRCILLNISNRVIGKGRAPPSSGHIWDLRPNLVSLCVFFRVTGADRSSCPSHADWIGLRTFILMYIQRET
jgi:hypothetical protein